MPKSKPRIKHGPPWYQRAWEKVSTKIAIGAWAGVVGTLFGLIVAAPKVWEVVEPVTPATSGYVRTHVDKTTIQKLGPFERRMDDLDVWRSRNDFEMAQVVYNQQKTALYNVRMDLEKNPGSTVIKERMAEIEADMARTMKRIQDYQAQPSGRREISK